VGGPTYGRVIAVQDGDALVWTETGTVRVACAGALPPVGAWVSAADGRFEVLSAPLGAFPQPDGDWQWMREEGARRARALELRARVVRAVREHLDARGFLEVETPLAVPSPGLDLHLDAVQVDARRWLVTSPEYQMKRLVAAGFPRVYQICRCFRANEAGTLHEPEFTMLEWYRAFAGSAEVMRDTEELVADVVRRATGGTALPSPRAHVDVAPPWERLTVREAFDRYAGASADELSRDEERFFQTLVESVEPHLGRSKPTFLIGYPASMASLARLDPSDPTIADRFEAYVDGIEVCNGFGELVDAREQRARLEADQRKRRDAAKPVYPIDERFLAALEEGMPPSGGNALGLDRLVMLATGATAIADVVAIPAARS